MMNCLFFAALAAIAALAIASSDVEVIVYNGPQKCSNKGDEKLTKVEPDYVVGLHFTVTVDESSSGSRETIGMKIESSHDKGFAPSFTGMFSPLPLFMMLLFMQCLPLTIIVFQLRRLPSSLRSWTGQGYRRP